MSSTLLEANEFGRLFRGSTVAHGSFKPSGKFDGNGKALGEYRTDSGPVTDMIVMSHLDGHEGLGVIPIFAPNLCQFGVIDIDIHDEILLSNVRKVIYRIGAPLVPFRSKSGGLHLYMFFAEPETAAHCIEVLSEIRRVFGLSSDVEIFPKQKVIDKTVVGNWINLPYYGAERTTRYAINEYGNAMSLEEAIAFCKTKRTSILRVQEFLATLPGADGPPCLQTLRVMGTRNLRNEYLFSYARYARAKYPDDWEHEVLTANNELPEPVTTDELENTVLKSHRKKEYAYKCSQDPLKSICNRNLCMKREFGVGSNEISSLDFEELLQYQSDPPYYEWKVNGQMMRFFSEDDLLRQDTFRRQCTRFLHIVPHRLKDSKWVGILNKAFSNIIVKDIEIGDDISPGSQFNSYLTEFLTRRAMAATRSQLLMGRVFYDSEGDCYIFKAKDLLTFIQSVKQFRSYTSVEIRTRLIDMGGEPTRYYVDRVNKALRVWRLPKSALGEQEDTSQVDSIDFLEELGEEAF